MGIEKESREGIEKETKRQFEEEGLRDPFYRVFSSWAWLIFITCCGNRVLYAASSK